MCLLTSVNGRIKIIAMTIVAIAFIIGIVGSSDYVYAQLEAPTVQSQVEDLNVSFTWNHVDTADGYKFYFAPYPTASTIYEIDMGDAVSFSAELWDGAAFYIAVKAYQGTEESIFSNIDYFIISASDGTSDTSSEEEISGATEISLQSNIISIDGSGATVEGSIVTISSSGSYQLTGTLTDGQLIVDTEDEDDVILILNGIDIHNSTSAPLFIKKSGQTIIVLAANSDNTLSDGSSYQFEDADEDEPDAALFSKSDLTIEGAGTLTITANYNDALKSKDGLTIRNGTLGITSVDDGIVGKDYIEIQNGTITINAKGDGLKSTNDEDSEKGYISIDDGTLNITADADAIQAETNITINDGNFYLLAGGGNSMVSSLTETDSAKGIKGSVNVTISGGTFNIDSADDAIHSSGNIEINGGNVSIATGDDGLHADVDLTINSGTIDISKSYEGIESAAITVNDGDIHIISSDDGINVAGGTDETSTMFGMFSFGGDRFPGGNDIFSDSGDYHLYIYGGTIVINAEGDGVDSNGTIEMSGGLVIVNGPILDRNGALDYNGTFAIHGGILIAVGSSGMAQAPSEDSTQNAVLVNFQSSLSDETLINFQDDLGNNLVTFFPSKSYQSIVFSSPDLITNSTYKLYYGGSATGSVSNGVYQDGSYFPGTQYTEFTLSETITTIK